MNILVPNTLSTFLSAPDLIFTILDHLDTLDLKEITLLVFYHRENAVSATGFYSKLFKLVANGTNVHIPIDVIVLISLVNIQMIYNSCASTMFQGATLDIEQPRMLYPDTIFMPICSYNFEFFIASQNFIVDSIQL